nr:hypothetical protein [Tanacetum cinerariifolium]
YQEITLPEKEVEVEAHKIEGESLKKEITKKQKMDEEAKELRSHLQIIRFIVSLEACKKRFKKTEPKNYFDDYLMKSLKTMFKQPDVVASVWRDQKGKYGLAKTHFTLEKMLNNVRLEVEEESEMSLELLRGGLLGTIDFNILLLLFILSVAAWNYC